jgi:dTMP kinase
MMKSGVFISLEGIEGAGKTTVLKSIQTELQVSDRQIIYTREPGGTPIAERIRTLLTAHENKNMLPMTELLMMYASRNEHIQTIIKPALERGDIVISDRFVDASYAYQGAGRHIPEPILETLDQWVIESCMPDLTICLTAPVELCLERVYSRGNQDRFDEESASFFVATQLGYQQRAKDDPTRIRLIDSSKNPEAVSANVMTCIYDMIKARSKKR